MKSGKEATVEENEHGPSLADDIRTFAETELEFRLAERDASSTFLRENWEACARKGVLGLCFPQEYGGSGYDLRTTVGLLDAPGLRLPRQRFDAGT